MNEDGVLLGKALTSNNIAALRKDGSLIYKQFGGVIDSEFAVGLQRVKLVNIVGIWWSGDNFGKLDIEIPPNYLTLGVFQYERFYIVIERGAPLTWERLSTETKKIDNVIHIHHKKKGS